jgi:Undecaprenyl-phosphate galactose phosphotransferase WbaP
METPTLQDLSKLLTSPKIKPIPKRNLLLRKFFAGSILFVVDVVLLSVAMIISLILRDVYMPGAVNFVHYMQIMPLILCLFPLAFYLRGLYPGFGVDVIDELRNLTVSITIVYAILATMTFLVKGAWDFSRIAFLTSWLISLPLIPVGRSLIKNILSKQSWWGIPVIIIGAGQAGEKVIKSLRKHEQIGLRPVVAVDDDIDRWGYIEGIPVIGGLEVVPDLSKKMTIDHAIIAMPSVDRTLQKQIIQKYARYFTHTTVIPDLFGLSSLWVSTRDLGGILGLEVQQKLLKYSSRFKKRVFDILLATGLGIVVSPLLAVIAVMIKLDSRGSVFYRQKRMGIDDSRFSIVKFRTMHVDADERLKDLLDQDSELRREYDIYHKLRDDPRLTRVGKFLRKFSLDELPQFLNVLRGEMSLIGPRAYMSWEKPKMDGQDEMILSVKPGISGLWQVTDRNASSFEERNSIDVYYIRNWSMFLDFYILVRTISVVLSGRGAY